MGENDLDTHSVEASIAPWLSVGDGAAAVRYYEVAFGAAELYRLEDDRHRVAVARLAIGQADFWIQEDPDSHSETSGGPIRMLLTVNDPDLLFEQALAAGAKQVAPVSEGHGWRIGRLVDPFGHHWEVGRPLQHPS